MLASKDWSFDQILANLFHNLVGFCIYNIFLSKFAVKQEKSIMAKLNRIRVVFASHEALIAIANALEVPVQELVRQEEFNQEK